MVQGVFSPYTIWVGKALLELQLAWFGEGIQSNPAAHDDEPVYAVIKARIPTASQASKCWVSLPNGNAELVEEQQTAAQAMTELEFMLQ